MSKVVVAIRDEGGVEQKRFLGCFDDNWRIFIETEPGNATEVTPVEAEKHHHCQGWGCEECDQTGYESGYEDGFQDGAKNEPMKSFKTSQPEKIKPIREIDIDGWESLGTHSRDALLAVKINKIINRLNKEAK